MVNITPSVTCTRNGTTITCSLTHDQGATWTTVQRQGAAQFLVNQGTPLPGSCSETVSKGTYKYILTDSVGHHSDSQATNFITANCPKSANSFLIQSNPLDLLVPRGSSIFHYSHPSESINGKPWDLVDKLRLPKDVLVQDTALSLVQSNSTPGVLEAIARVTSPHGSDRLVSYQFLRGSDEQDPLPVMADDGPIDNVTGSHALLQSDQDTFELLVPRGSVIFHYTHTNQTVKGPWQLIAKLPLPEDDSQVQVISIAFTQSDGVLGSLKAIAHVTTSQGDFLVGYEFDPLENSWTNPIVLTANDPSTDGGSGPINNITGSHALIQSNYSDSSKFELLVPQGVVINHYSHEGGSITDGSWQVVATLEPPDNQTKPIAVSLVQNTSGELDTVSRVRPQRGNDFIVGYEFDPTSSSWTPASVLKSDHGPIIANNSGDDSNNDDNGNGHHQDPGSGNVLQGG